MSLAGPTWAQSPSNSPAPPAASFPVDPAPQAAPPVAEPPSAAPLPAAPPPPPQALPSPPPEAPPAPPPPEPSSSDDDEPPRHEPRYDDYRLQLVASDALWLGLAITAGTWDTGPSEYLALTALGVYAFGAPVVHIAHGQPMRSLASLGARVGLPFAGIFVGAVAAAPFCAATSVECINVMAVFGALGFIGGGVTAMIIDDGFLGKVKLDEPAPEPALRRGHSLRAGLVPLVDPIRKTYGASLVGTF